MRDECFSCSLLLSTCHPSILRKCAAATSYLRGTGNAHAWAIPINRSVYSGSDRQSEPDVKPLSAIAKRPCQRRPSQEALPSHVTYLPSSRDPASLRSDELAMQPSDAAPILGAGHRTGVRHARRRAGKRQPPPIGFRRPTTWERTARPRTGDDCYSADDLMPVPQILALRPYFSSSAARPLWLVICAFAIRSVAVYASLLASALSRWPPRRLRLRRRPAP